jgi:hypothetical protein
MANFDEFKQKAKDTMETIADKSVELYKIAEEKTKLLAKITKLSAEMTLEKGNLRKLQRELGRMYYELHKDVPEDPMVQTCTEITSSLEFIAKKQKEIDALKGFADYEPAPDDEPEEKDDVEIIVEDFSESAPGNTAEDLKSGQDTDTLEEPESDAGIGKTPPSFRF